MDLKYMQTFLVVPAHAAVGLTSVALGIVRALQNLGGEVRFVHGRHRLDRIVAPVVGHQPPLTR